MNKPIEFHTAANTPRVTRAGQDHAETWDRELADRERHVRADIGRLQQRLIVAMDELGDIQRQKTAAQVQRTLVIRPILNGREPGPQEMGQ